MLVTAACLPESSPATLLELNRTATEIQAPPSGSVSEQYSYQGQGLEGSASSTFDPATGNFIDRTSIASVPDAHGFDGATAWMQDFSGAYVPEQSEGSRALAISEAYRHANAWWRADRGGAQIEPIGCDGLRVTPSGGNAFEAWFDAATHLLNKIREVQPFGVTVETRYADYREYAGHLVPTQIEVVTNDDPTNRETMRLVARSVNPEEPPASFAMPVNNFSDRSLPSQGRVTLPFRLLNNHIIVDVRVDGRGPIPFLVDSGGHDIVTPATIRALGLGAEGEVPSGGSGEQMVTSGYARVKRIDVGGAVLTDQTVVTLDFSPLAVEGLQLGGMLGLEFLERFVVQFDYGGRTMTIIDPRHFDAEARRRAGTELDFAFYDHCPQISGAFDDLPVRLNIDTGSRSDLTLTSPFVERAHLREQYPHGVITTEGWGATGPTKPYVIRGRSVTLGSVSAPGPIVGLSMSKKGAFSDANYDGNVGSGVLKRFKVTFDYAGQRMYLQAARQIDQDTGHFDRSGMWLNLAERGMQVMDVTPGGPAAETGIKVGDVLVSIGGKPIAGRALSDVRRSLKLVPLRRPLAVRFMRDGRDHSVTLMPRELIP
ncbi:MAG TPA: aspartyl protease family protein [Steroidobacteraceae bacterium]